MVVKTIVLLSSEEANCSTTGRNLLLSPVEGMRVFRMANSTCTVVTNLNDKKKGIQCLLKSLLSNGIRRLHVQGPSQGVKVC